MVGPVGLEPTTRGSKGHRITATVAPTCDCVLTASPTSPTSGPWLTSFHATNHATRVALVAVLALWHQRVEPRLGLTHLAVRGAAYCRQALGQRCDFALVKCSNSSACRSSSPLATSRTSAKSTATGYCRSAGRATRSSSFAGPSRRPRHLSGPWINERRDRFSDLSRHRDGLARRHPAAAAPRRTSGRHAAAHAPAHAEAHLRHHDARRRGRPPGGADRCPPCRPANHHALRPEPARTSTAIPPTSSPPIWPPAPETAFQLCRWQRLRPGLTERAEHPATATCLPRDV